MRLTKFVMSAGAATVLLAHYVHAQIAVGGACDVDTQCATGCCADMLTNPVCIDKTVSGPGEECIAFDGCDCEIGLCVNGMCPEGTPSPVPASTGCDVDIDCDSGCCASELVPSVCIPKSTQFPGERCNTDDGCDCIVGLCIDGFCEGCVNSAIICGDPHMQGLRGQKIDWSGVDGGWYSLVSDDNAKINVNVRLTAPLPKDFPDRQLITGLGIVSMGHSLVIEVINPYDADTNGCPSGTSRCLANGGLRTIVDGKEEDWLLVFSRNEYVAEGITVSASNLPVECRQFGGDKIWALMYDEMLQGRRQLALEESFEDWILSYDRVAAPDWCEKYITEHDLADVQSIHAVFKIVTSSVTVRLIVGTNYEGNGELHWDGRVLPDLEFWQMDVGLLGLSVESESLSGILGETARPVVDDHGRQVMEGYEAFRGTVEDYRVSGPVGTEFALLSKE